MDETKIGMLILLVVGLALLKALAGLNTAPKPVSKHGIIAGASRPDARWV